MKNIAILLLALLLIVQPAAALIPEEDFKPEDMTTLIIRSLRQVEGSHSAAVIVPSLHIFF